jgi:hypothetical protein
MMTDGAPFGPKESRPLQLLPTNLIIDFVSDICLIALRMKNCDYFFEFIPVVAS